MEQEQKGVCRFGGGSIILPFAEGDVWGSRKLSVESHFDSDADLQPYEALLEMVDLVVHHDNLPELFAAMAGRLRQVAAADAAHFALYDPVKHVEGSTLVIRNRTALEALAA